MKAIYKNRLLKLAKHLRKGKLGHKKFNFEVLNRGKNLEILSGNVCGYQGCAIGEMPIAFKGSGLTFENCDITRALPVEMSFCGVLPSTATAKQVAANIEAFVKRKESK